MNFWRRFGILWILPLFSATFVSPAKESEETQQPEPQNKWNAIRLWNTVVNFFLLRYVCWFSATSELIKDLCLFKLRVVAVSAAALDCPIFFNRNIEILESLTFVSCDISPKSNLEYEIPHDCSVSFNPSSIGCRIVFLHPTSCQQCSAIQRYLCSTLNSASRWQSCFPLILVSSYLNQLE